MNLDSQLASKIMRSDELWEGEHRSVRAGDQQVLLLRVGGRVVAFLDRCAHLGTSLADATLTGEVIECPVHGWRYSALTGRGLNPAKAALRPVPVSESDGWICLGGAP